VPDGYRFRVIIPPKVDSNESEHVETDNSTTKPQSEHVETDNSTTEPQSTGNNHKRHLPLSMINLAEVGESNSNIKASSPLKKRDAIHENVVQKKVKLDRKASDVSENGGSGSNGNPDHGVSEGKKEPNKSDLLEMSGDEGGGESEEQNIKAGSGESSKDKSSTAIQRGDTDTSGTHQGAADGQRKRCIYGANCYR
jgi:hypothetical protein